MPNTQTTGEGFLITMKINKPQNWRIGQTLFNFFEWLNITGRVGAGQMGERCADIFFIDDELFKKYYREYLKTLEVTYETDEL